MSVTYGIQARLNIVINVYAVASLRACAIGLGLASLVGDAFSGVAEGKGAKSQKGSYSLFNPTPRELMREMATDRPDATESPITVDAGHVQVEASLFDFGRERRGGVKEEVLTYGALNIKFGVLQNADLQFVFDTDSIVRTRTGRQVDKAEGIGDLQVRFKWNLWGNDGGKTAFAVFPFVKIPLGSELSNDRVEGGLILPFSLELGERIGLGLMLETDYFYDDAADRYEVAFVHTAVLGVELNERWGAFVEYAGTAGTGDFEYEASANTGLTFSVNENLQLDGGVRIGLNGVAEDFGVFAGFSARF